MFRSGWPYVAAQNFCQKISKYLSKKFGKFFPYQNAKNRKLFASGFIGFQHVIFDKNYDQIHLRIWFIFLFFQGLTLE